MNAKSVSTWEVYMIQTTSGSLYTGITNNLERRLEEHKQHKKGARYFNISSAKKVVFREPHPNRSEASKRESAIKKMTRNEKLALIQGRKDQKDLKDINFVN